MKTRAQPISADIPTGSFADIAFLLIIFFMLTLTFALHQGLDLKLPEDEPATVIDPVESVLVEIQPDASLVVDRRPMELGQLLAYLAPRLAQNPAKPVILHPLPEAPYGAMVAVYDELRRGRAELGLAEEIQVALPTEREISIWQ